MTQMTYESVCHRLVASGWELAGDGEPSPLVVLEHLKALAAAGRLPADGAAMWYATVHHLRATADRYERDLIRQLKYADGLTWEKVAEAVGVLSTRQAAQAKWKRLIDPERPVTTGQMRRGGRRRSLPDD